jgi:hypothetical protein
MSGNFGKAAKAVCTIVFDIAWMKVNGCANAWHLEF